MNSNSVLPYSAADLKAIQEGFGITNFVSNTGVYQVIGGLILQIGKTAVIPSSTTIQFHVGFPKQALGVWIQGIEPIGSYGPSVRNLSLTGFDILHGTGNVAYYWIAVGV